MYLCKPIGHYKVISESFSKDTLPRQPCGEHIGNIILEPSNNFEMALHDLSSFNYIWVIFWFNEVISWRPKVTPPKSMKKRGVFATRSPHRPNPIGLSVVELLSVNKRTLTIRGADLLNNTPVLDIKPYIAAYDSLPNAKIGWLLDRSAIDTAKYVYIWSKEASTRALWIEQKGVAIRNDIELSLQSMGITPNSSNRIRIVQADDKKIVAIKAYRAWRVYFAYKPLKNGSLQEPILIEIISIHSGYTDQADLAPEVQDRWNDKDLHRQFHHTFDERKIMAEELKVLE